MLRGISPDDIKLGMLALAGPVVITAVCIVARGKERWLFVFGFILFGVLLVGLWKLR
jgi:hypothetical protein